MHRPAYMNRFYKNDILHQPAAPLICTRTQALFIDFRLFIVYNVDISNIEQYPIFP